MRPSPLSPQVAPRGRGFTLIELLVVMAILGVLAAAVMPLGEALIAAQKEQALRAGLGELRAALDDYKRAVERNVITRTTQSGYPPTLDALVSGAPDIRPATQGQMVYFLRSLPRDPFAAHEVSAAASWKLRSYASPAERPQPGLDVFDVFSSSTDRALDGSLYSSW